MSELRRYGWKPSPPDHRDLQFEPNEAIKAILPPIVDLRPGCPDVYDQADLGSCTANAIGALAQFLQIKEKLPENFTPSRLFIYYLERYMEGTIREDAGASIRDGMKVVANYGCPHETMWPYNTHKFAMAPPRNVYVDGSKHRISKYVAVNNTNIADMKNCLASGFPVVGGFTVYESFEGPGVAAHGVVPMPSRKEKMMGGHAILVVGYDDNKQTLAGKKGMYIVRNSWSAKWGAEGYFYIPYDYFSNRNLATDFWSASLVS